MNKFSLFLLSLGYLCSSILSAAIYYDFEDEVLTDAANGTVGGWFTPQIGFGEWTGDSQHVAIGNGVLTTETSNGYRGAALVLDPTLLEGAGDYTLNFDVTRYIGEAHNNGKVSIWSGSGYDLTGTSADALIINTLSGDVKTSGNATATELESYTFDSTLENQSIAFNYDGTSALVFYFGAETDGWPFPTIDFDNIQILSDGDIIPEPNAYGLLLGIGCISYRVSRRKRR